LANELTPTDVLAKEALQRYREAYELERQAMAAWVAAGKPLTTRLGNGIVTTDPLLKVLQTARRQCFQLMDSPLVRGRAQRGPAPSAVPGVKQPGSAKL
jgi:hypothetical protein